MKPTFDEIEKMHDFISGRSISSSVYVATKLGIADLLYDEKKTVEELAEAKNINPNSLYRLMRALSGLGIFKEENNNKREFSLTSLGSAMCSNTPNSMHDLIIMCGAPWHCELWAGLDYSVETGKPYFVKKFGQEFFNFIRTNPEIARQFHGAMSSLSSISNAAVANSIDFSKENLVADIGGGEGGLLLSILTKWSHLRGVLFDIESAIEKAKLKFSENFMEDRCQLLVGDFFKQVPKELDAYIIKHVLHGLDKNQSIQLLKNVSNVAKKDSRILIVEMVMPDFNEPSYSKFNDLEMMLFSSTGCERSINDFQKILKDSALVMVNCQHVQMGLHIIEAKRIES